MRELILAAFDGEHSSSRIVLEQAEVSCRKLLLPNDGERTVELLYDAIRSEPTFCVILLGQRSSIQDKISVEPSARLNGEALRTPMDVGTVRSLIRSAGYAAYISRGCGTSRSNGVYYRLLGMGLNAVLLHLPAEKNISDIPALVKAVENVAVNVPGIPTLLR